MNLLLINLQSYLALTDLDPHENRQRERDRERERERN